MPAEILYYVHHHGSGHLGRAREICRHLPLDVTLVSSLPSPELTSWEHPGSAGRRRWVTVPWDTGDGDDPTAPARYPDPDAAGMLHWAPIGHPGLQARNAALLACIAERSPSLVVSDVSAEIVGLARLSGVPTVMVALPGDRSDAAHQWAFGLCRGLLAPWPRPSALPEWLRPWRSRTCFAGGIGGATPSSVDPVGSQERGSRRVLVAFGAGERPGRAVHEAAAATPGWTWDLPDTTVSADEWRGRLADADVVVAHAGLGTVADLAISRSRALVIPQPRPFGEQHATGWLLQDAGIDRTHQGWPEGADWNRLLDKVSGAETDSWGAWGVTDGSGRAARWLVEQVG